MSATVVLVAITAGTSACKLISLLAYSNRYSESGYWYNECIVPLAVQLLQGSMADTQACMYQQYNTMRRLRAGHYATMGQPKQGPQVQEISTFESTFSASSSKNATLTAFKCRFTTVSSHVNNECDIDILPTGA
jgi:hypothetical protein